jgi:RecA-family ATPase
MTWNTLTQLQEHCKHLPPSTWIVEDLLRNNTVRPNLLCGFPHVGKSTLGRQLASAVSRGQNFLGRKTQQGHVVYWASEDTEQDIVDFFRKQGAAFDNVTVIHSDALTLEDRNAELNEFLKAHAIREHAAAVAESSGAASDSVLPVSLVIIETLEDFFQPRNVNDNSEMTTLITEFRDSVMKVSPEICFMFLHHFNKDTKVEAQRNGLLRVSGARAIISQTASKWFLYTESDEQPERIFYTKVRPAGTNISPTYLQYDKETDTVELGETVAEVKKSTKSAKTVNKQLELDQQIVSMVEKSPGITKTLLRKSIGGRTETVTDHIAGLIKTGVLKTKVSGRAEHLFTSSQEITESVIAGWQGVTMEEEVVQ